MTDNKRNELSDRAVEILADSGAPADLSSLAGWFAIHRVIPTIWATDDVPLMVEMLDELALIAEVERSRRAEG